MSQVLYEWEFVNYICRVVESEPGIVHFEQARKGSGGDPRVMEFQRTTTPIGAANEIIQLHQALGEAKMLNRDLAAFFRGCQEDRNRRERELADAMEERDRLRDLLHRVDPERVDLAGSEQSWERQSEELSQTVLRVAEQRDKALADLEAARVAIRVARDHVIAHRVLNVIPADTWNVGWDEWDELPAVRAAREGK